MGTAWHSTTASSTVREHPHGSFLTDTPRTVERRWGNTPPGRQRTLI